MIDIQKIAREAWFDPHDMSDDFTCNIKDIERFAALYREAVVAELLAGSGEPTIKAMTTFNEEITFLTDVYMKDQLAGAVLRERERCAKVCENLERKGAWITKEEAAKAIRNQQ